MTTTSSTKSWYATPAKRQDGAWIVVETLDANYLYHDPALAESATTRLDKGSTIKRREGPSKSK